MIYFLVILIILILINLPVGYALGTSALFYLVFYTDINLIVLPQKIFSGTDIYAFLAIFFFLLAAELMIDAELTPRIINVFNALFGRIRGSLAISNVGASMFFAGVSGSKIADVSSIGSVLIPAMNEEGYEPEFSAAVTASSAICGPIIPPSLPMIIYGIVAKVSILGLFLGGAIPGILLGFSIAIVTYILSRIRKYPKHPAISVNDILKTIKEGFWALMMPIILIGGIISGVFTVIELAAVAVIYAFIIGFFVYKKIKINLIPAMFVRVAINTAAIVIIMSLSNLFSLVLTIEHIPEKLSLYILSITDNKIILLIFINILVLIAGMFLDSTPATIIFVPVLLPVVTSLGISPLHFGVILVFNLMIGGFTPPVCVSLMIANKIAGCNLIDSLFACKWFFLITIVILLFITYYPPLTEYLPKIILNR
jgi:tripartite ATP-independent transporter DctM subunit